MGLELWTALILGFTGSWHCVGMCGPIALALPYQGMAKHQAFANVLLYNLGRTTTYGLIGIFAGLLGKILFVAGIQQYVAIGLGIILLIAAIFSINIEAFINRFRLVKAVHTFVKQNLGRYLQKSSASNFYGIGLLNGLLPCGLVYFAVAGAVNSSSIVSASLFMVFFGLGTIPLMLVVAIGGQVIPLSWRRNIQKVTPFILFVFAILFIMRGLQFEVPRTLQFWESMNDAPMCH